VAFGLARLSAIGQTHRAQSAPIGLAESLRKADAAPDRGATAMQGLGRLFRPAGAVLSRG
jgi:hypothetical protein